MCGICGELTFDNSSANLGAIQRMTGELAPRGPDAEGVFAQGRAAFGHRRLRVIDLSEHAQQPMVDADLGLALVFNGCIYNYPALRKELQTEGYRFFSSGDTEVILKAWHRWGPECVHRFNGMFAFAVWERDTGRVHLVRDRLGIKPLYWTRKGARMRFASSLPALVKAGGVSGDIDPVALRHYMTFHAVVPAPRTILADVRKLPPATIMTVEADGSTAERPYWSLSYGPKPDDEKKSEADWQDEVLAALRRSVALRMVADVPVGVLLSGGLDSSLITGLMAEAGQTGLNTFSVGFEAAGGEEGDEFRYSDIVAETFGTTHHKIMVPGSRLVDTLPRCIRAMSEPMVSHDAVGFFILSEEVSRHLKVVQSGQGADEVFAGYHWYPPLVDSRDPVGDYARVFFDRDEAEYRATVAPRFHGADHARDFVAAHFAMKGAESGIDKALRLDTTVMLVDDPVKRVDNMTMAWGLEARVPFLDYEVVELAARVPAALKIRDGGKWVVKEAARKVVPAAVIDRPKGYFPVPTLKYLSGPALDFVRSILDSPAARGRDLFQRPMLDEWLAEPGRHITPLRGSKLWQAALLEGWLQNHGL